MLLAYSVKIHKSDLRKNTTGQKISHPACLFYSFSNWYIDSALTAELIESSKHVVLFV